MKNMVQSITDFDRIDKERVITRTRFAATLDPPIQREAPGGHRSTIDSLRITIQQGPGSEGLVELTLYGVTRINGRPISIDTFGHGTSDDESWDISNEDNARINTLVKQAWMEAGR